MRRVLLIALSVLPAVVSAQAPAAPQMPVLPLVQIDERGPAADLDGRSVTLSLTQPVAIKDLLLQIVRGTTLSIVPDPAIGGFFVGELKNVTVRQALDLVLAPFGLDYRAESGRIRVFPRALATRIFNINYVATDRSASATVGVAGGDAALPSASVTSSTRTDLFTDLGRGVQGLLSERASFNVDRKAGIIQVTDLPERLDRIAEYLDAVQDRVHRQVEIEARVVEIERTSADQPSRPSVVRVNDQAAFMMGLAMEGRVATIAQPKILVLNNEPAIVHTGGTGQTDALTLSVTPQISENGIVTLSLSPIVAVGDSAAAGANRQTVHEADTVARVAEGDTLVVSGFARDRETPGTRTGRRTTPATRSRVELLILLTPRVR